MLEIKLSGFLDDPIPEPERREPHESRRVPRSRVYPRSMARLLRRLHHPALFGFFVVLFAFAKADQRKQTAGGPRRSTPHSDLWACFHRDRTRRLQSPRLRRRNRYSANRASEMAENLVPPARVQRRTSTSSRRKLEQNLSGQLAAHSVSIHMGRDGLVISLREAGFFASGSATPSAATLGTLRQVAASLEGSPYDLRIEGHTDSLPIHSAEFDSNWELSTTRATSIARLMLDLKALPPDQISAAGYAGFHPVASNETEEGRAENRRVDLVLVPRTYFHFPDSGSTQAAGSPWRRITDN
jgi:chemotaxis protein MotB